MHVSIEKAETDTNSKAMEIDSNLRLPGYTDTEILMDDVSLSVIVFILAGASKRSLLKKTSSTKSFSVGSFQIPHLLLQNLNIPSLKTQALYPVLANRNNYSVR